MFNFTDNELGLAMKFRRDVDATVSDAQAIVDSKNASIDTLRATVRALLADLEDEKALRHAAELRLDRLNRLLDTPLN